MKTWAVVLAGGVGSRFWPLSTPQRPKQLLALVGDRPLIVEAVDRLHPLTPIEQTLILTNASLVSPIAALFPSLPSQNLIAEPRPIGTAGALTWAAQEIARRDGPEAVMISVHADWAVGDAGKFRDALTEASAIAVSRRALVTVGVVPTRPDPGFGYIQTGDTVEGSARQVQQFVEKPDRRRAEQFQRDGWLWNSGIFVWRVGDFLDEVRRHTPEVATALHAHAQDMAGFFGAVTPISVDVGVLERSDRVLVVPGSFDWDDVGTWAALRRVRRVDRSKNATHGSVHAVEAENNVVHSVNTTVVLYGVNDLVVVAEPGSNGRPGVVMVTTVDRSVDLKKLVDALPPGVREPR